MSFKRTNNVFKILTTFCLVSCGSPPYTAPLSKLDQPPSYRIQTHTVASGETLYSIAWRYNLDAKKLALVNNIGESFTIHPGQRLNLDLTQVPSPKIQSTAVNSPVINRSSNPPKKPPVPIKPRIQKTRLEWQWPVNGTLLATFSGPQSLNNGIDIGAKKGEPVFAAAAGTVVYAGDGLRGYGNLLILKHNDNYLSAYAHNQRLTVAEGDSVKAGQKIAEIGSSGTNNDKLHFEIRHDGKPVDPLRFLPRR
ncbi:peptidoglycan DD-metalloendopeptidase family protein [Aurantivibrio infirmus]